MARRTFYQHTMPRILLRILVRRGLWGAGQPDYVGSDDALSAITSTGCAGPSVYVQVEPPRSARELLECGSDSATYGPPKILITLPTCPYAVLEITVLQFGKRVPLSPR